MKVTVKYNVPIGNFKAIERTETFFAESYFESGNLVYFRSGYNYKTFSKSEVVKIEN